MDIFENLSHKILNQPHIDVLSAGNVGTLSVTKLLLASSSIKFRDPYPIPVTSQRRLTCSYKQLQLKHPQGYLKVFYL